MDDLKTVMKARLQTCDNDNSENEPDKVELNIWKEKALGNKCFIEKEIIAGKEMIKKIKALNKKAFK